MAGTTKGLMTVEEVRARLEEWRRNRQGRAAIPEELWSSAIEVAHRDGVGHIATALRLDYGKLKRLMLVADGVEKRTTPSFMELIAPEAAPVAQCAIELEGRRGKIRIELKANAADLASFSRTLVELVL
jgi:hypothetical protein